VRLHVVLALGDVVEVAGAVLAGLEGLVLFMHGDDVLPLGEEVGGLSPEVRDGRHKVLKGRVVGVVEEEGVEAHGQQCALRIQICQHFEAILEWVLLFVTERK